MATESQTPDPVVLRAPLFSDSYLSPPRSVVLSLAPAHDGKRQLASDCAIPSRTAAGGLVERREPERSDGDRSGARPPAARAPLPGSWASLAPLSSPWTWPAWRPRPDNWQRSAPQ